MKAVSSSRRAVAAMLLLIATAICAAGDFDYTRFRERFGRMSLKELTARGWDNIKKEHIDSAAAFYSIATSRYSESLPPDEMERCGVAFVNTGYIWLFIQNNAEQAYPWLTRAADIGERHDLPQVRIGAYDNLAKVYADYNNYPKAMELYKKAFSEAVGNRLEWGVTMAFIDLATLARNHGSLHEISAEIDTLGNYSFSDSPLSTYCMYLGRGLAELVNGDPDKACALLEESHGSLNAVYERERYHANHAMLEGSALLAAGRRRDAVAKFREGEALSVKYGLHDITLTACNDLTRAYRATGDSDSAHYYEFRALLLRDSLYNMSRYDIIKDMEAAVALAGLHDDLRSARVREDKQHTLAMTALAGAIVAILLLAWVYVKNRKLQRSNNELFRKNMEMAGTRISPGTPRGGRMPQNSVNDDGKAQAILEKIYDILETSNEIFGHDFTLERMATLTGVRQQQVSQAIGDLTGKNFSTLLGEYRIREACRRLTDTSTYGRYTIESISESVGYRSRTHFSRVFKTVTGMTTTEFLRQARNQNSRTKEKNDDKML